MKDKGILALLLLIISIITFYFFARIWLDGYRIWGNNPIHYDKTGEVGDFIGGVVGTIINAGAFYFLYLTLREQRLSSNKQARDFENERFESKFFDLVKIHRDNIVELKYEKLYGQIMREFVGREVFKIIFKEFHECLSEVRKYCNSDTIDFYILPTYQNKLKKITAAINQDINILEMAFIDISYCVVFFGLDEEGEKVLRDRFKKLYSAPFIFKLLKYLKLKPKNELTSQYNEWLKLFRLNDVDFKLITEEIYQYEIEHKKPILSEKAIPLANNLNEQKYYGGHQFRLGHYFRHLFQSYKFLNRQANLSLKEKYFYGKTLRAQLSTYEQLLLLFNSISTLGMKWEYTAEIDLAQPANPDNDAKLITKYDLVKNVPGKHYFGLSYRTYYPRVNYESEE